MKSHYTSMSDFERDQRALERRFNNFDIDPAEHARKLRNLEQRARGLAEHERREDERAKFQAKGR